MASADFTPASAGDKVRPTYGRGLIGEYDLTLTGTYDSNHVPVASADFSGATVTDIQMAPFVYNGTTAFIASYDDTNSVIRLWTGTNTTGTSNAGLIPAPDGTDLSNHVGHVRVYGYFA